MVSTMNNKAQTVEQLFLNPIPSSRGGSFYNAFPYPTKISPEAIAIYIACSTRPGETVLDAFSGSGSTGIAGLICEHPTKKMIATAKDLGVEPVWGKRNSILYEISTYASFAAKTMTNRLTADEYANAVDRFIRQAEKLIGNLYVANSPKGGKGIIRYAIWTEFLICPDCGAEIEYFKHGTSRDPAAFHKEVECPFCHKVSSVDSMAFAKENYNDKLLGKTIYRKKRKLAWIYGSSEGVNWDRPATEEDERLIQTIEDEYVPTEKPREIKWGDLHRTGYHFGITHLHHFYTLRNYIAISKLWKLTEEYPAREADALKLLLLSYNSTHCTLMTRVVAKHGAKDFVLTGAQSGVLYISKLPVEKNVLLGLRRKAKPFEETYRMLENCHGEVEVRNISSSRMVEPDQSVDFVFTDPPFGDFIPYAEVNQINELWLPKVTERADEVIISPTQEKGIEEYRDMLTGVLREIRRVAKDDSPIAVVFHAAKAAVWEAFSKAVSTAGLKIHHSNFLNKTQASFKQVVSKSAVQGDPVFLLKKSDGKNDVAAEDEHILDSVIVETPHYTEIERRHCYSIYIGRCMEKGIAVKKDAAQVYQYIQKMVEKEKRNDETAEFIPT